MDGMTLFFLVDYSTNEITNTDAKGFKVLGIYLCPGNLGQEYYTVYKNNTINAANRYLQS